MNNESTENESSKDASKRKIVFPPLNKQEPPESTRDPLGVLREIAADSRIDNETKTWLFNFAVSRFNNRRRMAYLSLIAILAFLVFLMFGALYDGMNECVATEDKNTCQGGILAQVKAIESLLVWIGGFLTSIVTVYYGVTSFRPSS